MFTEEGFNRAGSVVDGEGQDREAVIPVLVEDRLETRHLRAAASAPGGPEVHEHHLPPEVIEGDLFAGERPHAEAFDALTGRPGIHGRETFREEAVAESTEGGKYDRCCQKPHAPSLSEHDIPSEQVGAETLWHWPLQSRPSRGPGVKWENNSSAASAIATGAVIVTWTPTSSCVTWKSRKAQQSDSRATRFSTSANADRS